MPRIERWRLKLREGENMLAGATLSRATQKVYRHALTRFERYVMATQEDPTVPSVFNTDVMRGFVESEKSTVSCSSRAAMRWYVRNVMRDGQMLLELTPNVTVPDGRNVSLLGPEQLRTVVDAADADAELALFVGWMRWYLRPVALTRLEWSGITLNPYTGRAVLTVRDKGRAPGKLRHVQTTKDGLEILKRYRDVLLDTGCEMPDRVYVYRRGQRLVPYSTPEQILRRLRGLLKGLHMHARPYDLRHSFGRLGFEGLRAQGMSFAEALQLTSLAMGHEDVTTTRRYLHLTSEETVAVLDAQSFDLAAPVTVERHIDLRLLDR